MRGQKVENRMLKFSPFVLFFHPFASSLSRAEKCDLTSGR